MWSPSDLPIASGRTYHLQLAPEELARHILLVGDPDRVPKIANTFFSKIEVDRSNRGLRTMTGIVKESGLRVSIVTSGMGTPSEEIVLHELCTLNDIDFTTRKRKSSSPLVIIRIGTSGALQDDTVLGTPILTRYAVGLDNAGLFYDAPIPDKTCVALEEQAQNILVKHTTGRAKGKLFTYAAGSSPQLCDAVAQCANSLGVAVKEGITITCPGFFAAQGRDVSKARLSVPDIDLHLAALRAGDLRTENMEMESSFLLHFMAAQGHHAASLCVVIAHRRKETFMADYAQSISDATKVALDAMKTFFG